MNPLLDIQFRVPFDKIEASDVEPAIDRLLTDANARLEATIASERPLHALDTMTEKLDYAMSVVRHLESVATTPELRAAHNAIEPKVSAFYSSLPLNEGLWKAIQRYAATDEAHALTGTMKRYLTKTIDSFKRHGAELDAPGKARLQEIDVALAEATTKFSENVLDSTNAFDLVIEDEAQLKGLPPAAVAAARASAESKGRSGWRFTLQAPSYMAAMTYLDDRTVREQLYRTFSTRATAAGPGGAAHDNAPLLVKILDLRKEKARLLGFRDFSDFVLDDRMAHTGARAQGFLDDLRHKTERRFREENQELEAFAGAALDPWDVGYWAEKKRAKLYDFDEEALRPYFPLEHVVNGMFDIFGRVLGIRVAEESGVPVWDSHVKTFAVHDRAVHDRASLEKGSDAYLGSFYADWFPRENKRGGAWMDSLITGNPVTAKPHLGLICGNLTPPVDGKPALLTHREVETIFHEFGHLLHHLLSRVEVRSLAGTSVAWDFVELPSQIMENWCWERESLDLFARHWETGETIPEDLFQKMRRARTFRAANAQMRQLGFGYVDLALHREWDGTGDVIAWSRAVLQQFSPAPFPPEHAMLASFTHLFSSPVGYGAGYYSYKWAEVLDADAFTRFRKEGVFSASTGREYRDKILARGDSEDPAELYRSFMGRDPDPNALLLRAGLA
jgi:oligopeptidase A